MDLQERAPCNKSTDRGMLHSICCTQHPYCRSCPEQCLPSSDSWCYRVQRLLPDTRSNRRRCCEAHTSEYRRCQCPGPPNDSPTTTHTRSASDMTTDT